MRETHRRGSTPTSRTDRTRRSEVPPADDLPLSPAGETQNPSVAEPQSSAQPAIDQPGPAAAEQPQKQDTIRLAAVQDVREARQREEAQREHAVDTDRTVQEAYAPRRRRSDRKGHRQQRPRRSPAGVAVRAVAVLLVLSAVAVVVPRAPLADLVPEGMPGFTRPRATAAPEPTPAPTRSAPPAVDYGSRIVILDALSTSQSLPAFGDAFEGQLRLFGSINGVEPAYVRCQGDALAQEYAKLTAAGTPPVFVFGPYGALLPLAGDMSDLTDAVEKLDLSPGLAALTEDRRLLALTASFHGVFVRKSVWRGDLPGSYAELLSGAQALGGDAPASFPLGLPLGCAAGEAFCRDLLAAYGADLSQPQSCSVQDVAAALAWFQTAFDQRLSPTDSLYWDENQARNAVQSGVSAVTAGDSALLLGLESDVTQDLQLLAPLQGPKARISAVRLTAMAMPSAANPEAAARLFETYVAGPRLLEQALAQEPAGVLPAPNALLDAQDVADNPWAGWLGGLQDVTIRGDSTASDRTAAQAVASVVLGGYTPEQAAAWLLNLQ